MLFSVLVPHYNHFEYFKKCYESICAQTYRDFEIILVDDCSTDGSFEKIQAFTEGNSKIKVYRNDKNRGVGFTKRRCVELAKGEICGFVDPDDALHENALEISINNLDEKTVAAYSQLYLCDENLDVTKIFPNTAKVRNGKALFFNIHFEVAHFFTFRKSVYNLTDGINPELRVAEDQDLILKLYEKGDFKYIPQPLYYYRLHSGGLSHSKDLEKTKNESWHRVLSEIAARRGLDTIYGVRRGDISNLPEFIYKKENTTIKRLLRKMKCF